MKFDRALWERHVADLTSFRDKRARLRGSERAEVEGQLAKAKEELAALQGADAATLYAGTLGVDPAFG